MTTNLPAKIIPLHATDLDKAFPWFDRTRWQVAWAKHLCIDPVTNKYFTEMELSILMPGSTPAQYDAVLQWMMTKHLPEGLSNEHRPDDQVEGERARQPRAGRGGVHRIGFGPSRD